MVGQLSSYSAIDGTLGSSKANSPPGVVANITITSSKKAAETNAGGQGIPLGEPLAC